jgi:peroxin-7
MPYTYSTLPLHGNGLSFSPYSESLLASVSSQNFSLVGNGRLHILNISPQGIVGLKQSIPKSPAVDAWV